jgi:hypothetical protein
MIDAQFPSDKDRCSHPQKGLFRYPFKRGGGFHLIELCLSCGKKTRGNGVWVSRAEVIGDVATLPLAPTQEAVQSQPSLFDFAEGKHD